MHGFKLVVPNSPIDPYSSKFYVKPAAMDFMESLVQEELELGKLLVHHFSYSSDVARYVSDVSSAYRSIMTRPSDRQYQGLEWKVKAKSTFLVDNFLSFYTRMASCLIESQTASLALCTCSVSCALSIY